MRFFILLPLVILASLNSVHAQNGQKKAQQKWVDSVYNSLNEDQRIAQLMVIRAHSNLGPDHVAKVESDIKKYNVGALCFFQGGPLRQAQLTNQYQKLAQTPLMVTIDGEWGLGMRLDSVLKFPYQLTMGAQQDPNLAYRVGVAIGEQCKRIGVHVNYAPVVDVNNNPNNPVIGFRSFGEDRDKVSRYGIAIMKGMQDAGIMACAKHFPGHGDVDVDSHYDLPVINKSLTQLDSMELVPFKAIFDAGVGSVMIAHLYIPAIDTTTNKATSISRNNVTNLLRNKMNYQGLTFTDALEMKGVAKYFPGGTIAVEALIAGNDMLCLPANVGESIEVIKKAIAEGRLSQQELEEKVRKVLASKYTLGLHRPQVIDTTNLLNDLNAKTNALREEVARKSLVLFTKLPAALSWPLQKGGRRIAYVQLGGKELSVIAKQLQTDLGATPFHLTYKDSVSKADSLLGILKSSGNYDFFVVGVHGYSNKPADNFGISKAAMFLYQSLNGDSTLTITFGTVQAAKHFCEARILVAAHQDDEITQGVAADWLQGDFAARGVLPVSVCQFNYGYGIKQTKVKRTRERIQKRLTRVDTIVQEGLDQKAYPGAVVMAVHKGTIIYHKAFGQYEYENSKPLQPESIFDLASVTKISATTVAVMKLYEQGKLKLEAPLKTYLPWVKGTNKENLIVRDILLHQAGLVAFIPFFRETLDSAGIPDTSRIYATSAKKGFSVRVTDGLFLRDDWRDTIRQRIVKSPLGPAGKYVYSDLDFILLGEIVEQISGKTLDQFTQDHLYRPLGMYSTGFRPRNRFPVSQLVPTETEKHFRRSKIRGDVHDEGASILGGIAGHAGLFSNAYDLAILYQLLLDKGTFNGRRFFKPSTVSLFTSYQLKDSRRGLGFDKPERDNIFKKDPYPSLLASPETFGHTGFTGTCVWVDPKQELVYVFLSNRVYPTRNNNLLGQLQIRGRVQDAIYRALGADEE